MKRDRAVELVEQVLARLEAGWDQWPVNLLTEIYLFGSFARGALEPHDVDVAVEFARDERWASHLVNSLSRGRDPHAVFRRALTGGRRGLQFLFDPRASGADFEMMPLWRRGESIQLARERLHTIVPDPTAGRAPRDAMLPQFEGLESWIPRPYREHLVNAVESRAVALERFTLADGVVGDPDAAWHLARRWKSGSPLLRSAHAVLAYAERRGIDPGTVHLHGQDVRGSTTPYFAGFQLRYFRAIPRCLVEFKGVEWIEVVHPTPTQPLEALRITPKDLGLLTGADW